MKKLIIFFLPLLIILSNKIAYCQPSTKTTNGIIVLNDGKLVFRESNHRKTIDSLDSKLKANPEDTSALFYRALFYMRSNDLLSKPYQVDPKALAELTTAKNLLGKADALGMQDFRLKVLRAEIYAGISYRYTGDESWKFKPSEIAARRKAFNEAKEKANQYYEELARLDQNNAHDYQRRIVKGDYPIK